MVSTPLVIVAIAPLEGGTFNIMEFTSSVPEVVINGFRSMVTMPPTVVERSAVLMTGG